MVREKYLPYTPPEKQEEYKTPKQIRKEKRENFWFYYKKPIIIGFFVLLTVLIIWEPWRKRKDPDYTVLIASPFIWSDNNLADIEKMFSFYGEDVNGDGEIVIDAVSYLINQDTQDFDDVEALQVYLTKLVADISACSGFIFLCDETCIEWLGFSEQVFCRLDDKSFSEIDWTDKTLSMEAFAVNWHEVEAFDASVIVQTLENLDLYFAFRAFNGTALDHEERYEQSKALVMAMLMNTPTQQEAFDAWVAEQTAAMKQDDNTN